MEGLDVSKIPMDLIMNIINIVILFVIVRFLAYKPVRKFLDARKKRLEDEKAAVESQAGEAQAMCEEYEKKLSEVEAARAEAVRAGEKESQQRADELVRSAKKDADRLLSDAKQAIAAKEAESAESMRDSVVELSVSIASKVIGRNINDEDNKRLAREFFDEEADNIK